MGTPQIPSVDSDTKQLPDQVRARLATNIKTPSSVEGAATVSVVATTGDPRYMGKAQGLTADDEIDSPTFTRLAGNPVFTGGSQNPASGVTPAPSINWPYLVHAKAIPAIRATALDEWYLYYTTDHDPGYGGVYLATGPTITGPWTSQGLVFQNTNNAASQTENASVWWDDSQQQFLMLVKVFGTVMQTRLATSSDGRTWTDQGVVLDLPTATTSFPGNYQVGYTRPFRVGNLLHTHLLLGGGNIPVFGLAHSHDGKLWQIEGRPLMYGADQLVDYPNALNPLAQNQLRIEWNTGDVVRWRGRLWWIGMISNFTSNITPKNARLACAPIADDFRSLIGPVRYILQNPTGANESGNYRAIRAHVYDGKIYLYYQCDQNFNVAVSN